MTLSVLFVNISPHGIDSASQPRNRRVFCVHGISLPNRNRRFRYQHERFPGMTSEVRRHLNLLLSPSDLAIWWTVILSLKYTYAGSPRIRHQLEGFKIPDVSVLLYSPHLWTWAFGLSESSSVALGLKIEGNSLVRWCCNAPNIVIDTGCTHNCFYKTVG